MGFFLICLKLYGNIHRTSKFSLSSKSIYYLSQQLAVREPLSESELILVLDAGGTQVKFCAITDLDDLAES
jgi:hexokinase